MWQSHQFVRHMAEPQLKVSAFIYILIIKTIVGEVLLHMVPCILVNLLLELE